MKKFDRVYIETHSYEEKVEAVELFSRLLRLRINGVLKDRSFTHLRYVYCYLGDQFITATCLLPKGGKKYSLERFKSEFCGEVVMSKEVFVEKFENIELIIKLDKHPEYFIRNKTFVEHIETVLAVGSVALYNLSANEWRQVGNWDRYYNPVTIQHLS